MVAETVSVYRGEGEECSPYTHPCAIRGIAGAHYLPTLKSSEQIAREKGYRIRELRRRRRKGKKGSNNERNLKGAQIRR